MPLHYREPTLTHHAASVNHCAGPFGTGYTLCGDAIEGTDGNREMEQTTRRINCYRCKAIIIFCASVKREEY